jgi:Cdc6-like AAA superfamily ATPase
MEGFVIGVHGRVARIAGFYRPGALLESESGARMLVVGRRKALHPHYLEALRLARDGEAIPAEHEVVSVSRALIVSEQVPEPGERVREVEWRAERPGVYGPEGEVNLLKHEGIPHVTIIASTGMGKTTLVKMLLRQAASAGFRHIIVLDMHDEYGDVVRELGGEAAPPVLPLCDLTDHELLAATGLLRVATSPIRMMRYLRYFVRAFCRLAEKTEIENLRAALERAGDAMLLLDVISPDAKALDERETLTREFIRALRDELGPTAFNALREVVRKDEERMAATMMYLMWAVEHAPRVELHWELPDIVAIQLLEFRSIFAMSDIALAVMSYIFRRLMELKEPALVVIEEAPRLLQDETARRNLELFLSQARKFGVTAVLVSQTPHDLVQNTRLVLGRVQNVAWARKLAELAPQMPGELARLLPQLGRGEFAHLDGQRVVPLRVIV